MDLTPNLEVAQLGHALLQVTYKLLTRTLSFVSKETIRFLVVENLQQKLRLFWKRQLVHMFTQSSPTSSISKESTF